jgi:hypothetical protein
MRFGKIADDLEEGPAEGKTDDRHPRNRSQLLRKNQNIACCIMTSNSPRIEISTEDSNIEGILAALRYLSREAEGAGLMELAKALAEAELKCARPAENAQHNCQA